MPQTTIHNAAEAQDDAGGQAMQMEIHYRRSDFVPLFLRRQFARATVWASAAFLVTISAATLVYAISMAWAGSLGDFSLWLLVPPVLLCVLAGAMLFYAQANARTLHRFYQRPGAPVLARLDETGLHLDTGEGTIELLWQDATRFDVGRRGLVVWKGEKLPLVLPAKGMEAGAYDRMLRLISQSLAALRTAHSPAEEQTLSEEQTLPEETALPGEAAAPDAPIAAPDYSDSEYRFGDDWVPGGIRFRIPIGPRDREALKEYALSRPGSRNGFILLVLVAAGMAAWLFTSAARQDAPARTMAFFFAFFSAAVALLFVTGLVRPAWFLRLVRHLPGNRQRQDTARRDVLCVLSAGILYAKTEGRVDRVAIRELHDIVRFKSWLFLFRDRKTAYLIPLHELEPEIRAQLGGELGLELGD